MLVNSNDVKKYLFFYNHVGTQTTDQIIIGIFAGSSVEEALEEFSKGSNPSIVPRVAKALNPDENRDMIPVLNIIPTLNITIVEVTGMYSAQLTGEGVKLTGEFI